MRKLRFVTNLLLTVSFIAVLFRKIQNRLKLKIPRIYALYEKLTHEHAVLSDSHDFNLSLNVYTVSFSFPLAPLKIFLLYHTDAQ